MTPAPRKTAFTLSCIFVMTGLCAEDTFTPPTPEQLASQERVRPLVTALWRKVRSPSDSGESHPRLFWEISDRLIAIGPEVVPFLAAEMELPDPATFNIAAYALGRIGGPDAESALRKALRVADARGGRFGLACRMQALFGLALLGKPEAVELAQSGPQALHGAQIVPELPLHAHLALLVGRDAVPILAKQFDAFVSDPAHVDQLLDTVIALGVSGDATVVPKLVPLLTHASSQIRAQAADAISRLGDPALCTSLMPLLSSTNQMERIVVARALALWKPEPCQKAMIGRLEIEPDIEVRVNLYAAIVALGGESVLPVLRTFLVTSNQFDQASVVDAIGRIGSKKGLNILRALLPGSNPITIAHALQAIAQIGGEGAIDTLLATTADRRRFVAAAAQEILTSLGDKRVAPRRAEELLKIVREPVGNLSLRSPIVELTESLVTLGYTEPIDDLKSAISVQSDQEIVESLASCVRRLELLARNGDDAKAWAGAFASPYKDVRQLADRRLAEIGSPDAVRTLTTRLAQADLPPDARAEILLAIGQARTAGAADLVESNLAGAEFDRDELTNARAAAAFAARRLGGERMARALRASALRRDGQDWATLVYLAVIDKNAALPTLTSLRVRRLRYPDGRSGHQDLQLEEILRELAAGREPTRFDVPPETLFGL